MSQQPLIKVSARTAGEVCAHFNLSKQARALLQDGMDPRAFVEALLTQKQHVTGIDFMSHALPPREGIWWGCLCFQHAFGNELSPMDRAAMMAAVRWVFQPVEENRTVAKAPADALGCASPAGALASAVMQTGGGVAPPSPFAPAKSVAVAVKLATVKGDPARILDRQRAFVKLGVEVAEGRFL